MKDLHKIIQFEAGLADVVGASVESYQRVDRVVRQIDAAPSDWDLSPLDAPSLDPCVKFGDPQFSEGPAESVADFCGAHSGILGWDRETLDLLLAVGTGQGDGVSVLVCAMILEEAVVAQRNAAGVAVVCGGRVQAFMLFRLETVAAAAIYLHALSLFIDANLRFDAL